MMADGSKNHDQPPSAGIDQRCGDAGLQPFLHDLVSLVSAPALVLSAADGSMIGTGADGFYVNDRRVLSTFDVTVNNDHGVNISSQTSGATAARFVSVLRELGDDGADPTVILSRYRTLTANTLTELFTVTSRARTPVSMTLELRFGTDLADISTVKRGCRGDRIVAQPTPDGLVLIGRDSTRVDVALEPAPTTPSTADGVVRWAAELCNGDSFTVTANVTVQHESLPVSVTSPRSRALLPQLRVDTGDFRLAALVDQALADLRGLLLGDPEDPRDCFLAAGSPWFLTLFGRDSLIAARMLLPLGTELAGGTLRALARRQGKVVDVDTAEAPGKILHELRRTAVDHGAGIVTGHDRRLTLPAVYFGTVDATPLWIVLLHDSWQWGLADDDVVELLPALRAALGWLGGFALDERGFVSYLDESGTGIVNQGWKDSGDSIQFNNGDLAIAPIALCEVQAYAFSAAQKGAALLDAFAGADGTDEAVDRAASAYWRQWADDIGGRFRASFWIADEAGDYPAVALDHDGRQVDTVTSNIAHLLGTGMLTEPEEALVVARLGTKDMECGYGLRTMSSASGGFNPFSYHGGSVWTHDTALAIAGLTRVGSDASNNVAGALIRGLLDAAPTFHYRLPELFAVDPTMPFSAPVAYPASCRPQAWSAASAIALLAALVGQEADAATGKLRLRGTSMGPAGSIAITGFAPHAGHLSP